MFYHLQMGFLHVNRKRKKKIVVISKSETNAKCKNHTLALYLVEYEWRCPLRAAGTWMHHLRRHLLPETWSSKWSITLKVSYFGKEKMAYSLAWQCKNRFCKTDPRKLAGSSTPGIITKFSLYRFSFVSFTIISHKWWNLQKQNNGKQSFKTFWKTNLDFFKWWIKNLPFFLTYICFYFLSSEM